MLHWNVMFLMNLAQLDDRPSFHKDWFKDYSFHIVDSIDKLNKLVDMCISRGSYSIDLETTGVDNRIYPDSYFNDGVKTRHGLRTIDKIVGVCISFDGKNGYYVPLSHEPEDSGNLPWDPAWDSLERLVKSQAKAKLHNSKFDLEFLYPVTGKEQWKTSEFEDTYLIAKVISPLKSSPSGLKPLVKKHFGIDMIELDELFTPEMREQLKRDKKSAYNFGVLHPKDGGAKEYGCSDGIFTYALEPVLMSSLSESDKKIYNLEKSFMNVLRKMERNRVHIDIDRIKQLSDECEKSLVSVSDVIKKFIESKTGNTGRWMTLNVGAVKQLSQAIITDPEGLKLKPTAFMLGDQTSESFSSSDSDDEDDDGDAEDSPAGEKQYTMKDEAMKSLDEAYGKKFQISYTTFDGQQKTDSLFNLILEWRHYQKMQGSYIGPLMLAVDNNGDVRPDFRQMGTDTARLASRAGKIAQGYSGINFQGIPRDSDEDKPELFKQIRTCIAPRPGFVLVKLDFAGEELRVVTNLSGDPVWMDSFLHKDGDVHSITARTLFNKESVNKDERNRGKRCNFAFIYGGGAGAIQRNIGCSFEDAGRHMENLKKDVPVLMGYVDHQKAFARKNKKIITAYGRSIPIPTIDSPIKMIRSKAERCAINYTIQATSSDILKFAMCFVDKNIRERGWEDRVRYVLTVHDEVVYEVRPEYLMEIVRALDEWMTFPWKLPKAHGREWVVPLLTEPGIDINWKARFDYFKMVDGVPADPNKMVDGKYTGKLKSDEYFHNGRVYQKIPEFLTPYIRRLNDGETVTSHIQAKVPEVKEEPPASQAEVESAPKTEIEPLADEEPEKVIEKTDSVPPTPRSVVEPSQINTPKVQEKPARTEPDKSGSVPESNSSNSVYRFIFRGAFNAENVKKFHAICILCDGDTPIRVVSPEGKILVPEDRSQKVDRFKFEFLAQLFGVG